MTIDEMRAKLGVPPDQSAALYIAPPALGDFACINCGELVGAVIGGDCDCDVHCEGCCDCDPEEME